MNLVLLFLLLCVAHLGWVTACKEFKNCGSCIAYAKTRCVWCAQDTMNSDKPDRCQSRIEVFKNDKYDATWCMSDKIKDPDSSVDKSLKNIENREFSATKGKEVQFRPQKLHVTLRPGVPVPIDMYYKPLKDFPLDMYFLMDNSYSMQKYGKKLAAQTIKIYHELSKMTNNVRLGLGSFVEKPALPYADPVEHGAYAFKHHLSLTNDSKTFKKEVERYYESYGSNYDSPEAGLDALMQAMTCGDKIGWRHSDKDEESRRIIILATEATYHSAGDGKMVGAYKPNDMKCHLDEDNTYGVKESLTYDYPSLSQIKYIAKKNNFRIVFAVTEDLISVYDSMAQQIFAANTVKLNDDDDQLLEIIRNAYTTAYKNLKLQVSNLSNLKFTSNCDVPGNCVSTQETPTVHVKAELMALSCAETSHFEVNPFGLSNDKLTINIKLNCKCDCEGITELKSTYCKNSGVKECGVCTCDDGRSGEFCELACSDTNNPDLMKKCKPDENDVSPCNGQGICVCGKCICKKDFSGTHCEFDDAKCRMICPKDKGDCSLGQCICKDKSMWTGPECNCLASNIKCIGPFLNEPCSGRGECKCGECKCDSINDKSYYGKYCESCKDCAKELCESLKLYANCNYEKNSKTDCDNSYNQTSVEEVLIMNRKSLEAESTATSCRKKLDNNSVLVYKYIIIPSTATEPAKIKLMIQDEVELPPVANIWIAIGSVLGGILLVGLLTLAIWKISSNIYYKREYKKFCQEATKAGFDVSNPIYQDPNVNFVNPAYNANQR